MSAAANCIPVALGGMPQGFPMAQAQCPRLFKEEVLDPGYLGGNILATNGLPVNSSNIHLPSTPVTPSKTPQTNTAPAEKAKRSYTRKNNGAPKAKKIKTEPAANPEAAAAPGGANQSQIGDHMPVQKRKRDRFKGTTEEEVLTRVLPDHIREDLDILIVGINPGLTAAYVQHHYAGPGNHFWKCLYLSGMIPEPMNALQDAELQNYGIGFTNIVARTTRGSADLSRKEIYEGGLILKDKMLKYMPKIALFNGKGIYEVFCGHKNFYFGLQPDPFPGCPDTSVFVNPSSSARCTQLPRALDKVPFYEALKRVRDHIRVHGTIKGIDRTTVTFPGFKLVTAPQKAKKEVKEEPKEPGTVNEQSAANVQPQQTPAATTKAAKPKKPRGRPKREKPAAAGTPASAAPVISNEIPRSNPIVVHQSYVNSLPQHQNVLSVANSAQPLHNGQLGADLAIKREAGDAGHDKDLAAIIQQTLNVQQSMLQHQSIASANPMSHSMNGGNPALVMPTSTPSAVKQERSDWNGYGVMPAYNGTPPTSMAPYPQYSCYWSYLPTTSSFMTNGYSGIPAPQIAHQQAVAAAAALHTSVAVSQANVNAAAAVSYNSPQEASSPAMSSQSNLTQASLDSLPKADSASTVANWLQSIPHS